MSGTLWKEPREFRCLKGAWDNPVTANTPEDAQVLFRCEVLRLPFQILYHGFDDFVSIGILPSVVNFMAILLPLNKLAILIISSRV